MSKTLTLGVVAAARIVGISPQLLTLHAKAGKIPVARRKPLRVRLEDAVAYRDTVTVDTRRTGRPSDISRVAREILACAGTLELRAKIARHMEAASR